MASLKSKLLIGSVRMSLKLQGKRSNKPMRCEVSQVLAFRDSCEKGAARSGKVPTKVTVTLELINMVNCEWIIPDNAPDNKLIFYVHGGGYVSGSCNDHRVIVAKIAKQAGFTAFLYEYGLAPENPFPVALHDSINMYKTVIEKGYKPENIVMMGESAGGGLCLSVLLAIKDQNLPLPAAAVVVQPWADLCCTAQSYTTKNKVSLAPLNCWNVFAHFYVGNNDFKNPYISPVHGNLAGLPPIFLSLGTNDELYDDGLLFYHRATDAGVTIALKVGVGMIHCYPLLAPMFPEATQAMQQIVLFIGKYLNN